MDIDTHELNRVMAEVCGMEVFIGKDGDKSVCDWGVLYFEEGATYIQHGNTISFDAEEWSPCTDHNQMALVKEKLRGMGYFYSIQWLKRKHHRVAIWKTVDDGEFLRYYQDHKSELIAFAQAVQSWWKERVK